MTFGRFNPPTIGHEKLIRAVQKLAGSNDWLIIPSQSYEKKKNPLPYKYKTEMMVKMFPWAAKNIDVNACCNTPFVALSHVMSLGYTDVIFVAGSDRVSEYERRILPYNRKMDVAQPFAFNTIVIESAGERDPDADGAEGMSASKLRKFAVEGKTSDFIAGIPDTISASYKVAVMNKILENM